MFPMMKGTENIGENRWSVGADQPKKWKTKCPKNDVLLAAPTSHAAIVEVDFPEAKQFGETARQKRRALVLRIGQGRCLGFHKNTQERLELIFRGCGKGEGHTGWQQ